MQPDEGPLIGIVEDDPVMGGSLEQRLRLEGYRIAWWRTGTEAVASAGSDLSAFGLILCDLRLPDIGGEEIFATLAARPGCPPFLFVTGHGDIDQAVRLMRAGAVDFMTKPFAIAELLARIEAARRTPGVEGRRLGPSPAMNRVEEQIERFARHDLPVLITGETGVGKEVCALLLHDLSPRRAEPFMAVNCAAIPSDLLESEIFGHEKGAFTGADRVHLGYAERAKGGTLFLDEIGDMAPLLQAKILRLIEEGRFTRLGGETELPLRARIVAASHQDLESSGFRKDLFFRLAVLAIAIPPLRARPQDVDWLADSLLADAVARVGSTGIRLDHEARAGLRAHNWPGNVRELRNRIERAVALAVTDRIAMSDLFPDRSSDPDAFLSLSAAREAAERLQIERALDRADGRLQAAAQLLSVSRTTLWDKMTRLRITDRARSDS